MNAQPQLVDYNIFVAALFKKDTLPMMYLHCAVGIIGEVAELAQAMTDANEVEELGDMAFYVQAGLYLSGLPALMSYADTPAPLGRRMLFVAGDLLDCAKRFAIYGKELEMERWNRLIQEAASVYFAQLRSYQRGWGEVRLANMQKLEKRYPGGIFKAEDAIARADKPGENESA